MSHWEFLESKVGKDVMRYIIQPLLLPSESQVKRSKFTMVSSMNEYFDICEYWWPSMIKVCEDDNARKKYILTICREAFGK